MLQVLTTIALAAIPAIIAITLHEAAHGYAALALGDDTAKQQGRLSLNPLRHVDDVGTLILPGILILTQVLTIGRIAFLFGWAKPVPVAFHRLRQPKRDMVFPVFCVFLELLYLDVKLISERKIVFRHTHSI